MSFRSLRNRIVAGVLGLGLVTLGLYLAPSEAYELQEPFRDGGEEQMATVVSTGAGTRSYEAGGQNGGTRTYEVLTVDVELDNGRKVRIDHLVLARDHERLSAGDSVSITLIRGDAAKPLPRGPFYMLTSSVHAGPTELLGWAFNGRPASGRAIAAFIPGLIILLLVGALAIDRRRKPE